jgi:hypothetical protein
LVAAGFSMRSGSNSFAGSSLQLEPFYSAAIFPQMLSMRIAEELCDSKSHGFVGWMKYGVQVTNLNPPRKLYQIQNHIPASVVLVYDRMDGSMAVTHNVNAVKFAEIVARPVKEKKPLKINRKIYHPSKHDYWKNFKFGVSRHEQGHFVGLKQ